MSFVERRIAIATATALCILGGCGEDMTSRKTVDAPKLEKEIEQSLTTATAKVTSAACPDDVKNETGTTFTCRVKLSGGGHGEVKVKITRAPNKFSYSFKPGTVVLAGASIDKALQQELAANGVANATVNCPDTVRVKAGTTVTCPVTGAGGRAGSVSFEFSDAAGSIEGSSVKAES